MKFGKAIIDEKMKITWVPVTARAVDLVLCEHWIKKNQTMWVICGKRRDASEQPSTLAGIRARIAGDGQFTQQFGFRAAQDALMFKLSMSKI